MPWLPTRAAALLTLRSPRSMLLDVQADRLPASKPSAKIRSDEPGVFVAVDVAVLVGVLVGVPVAITVDVFVGVFVGVRV